MCISPLVNPPVCLLLAGGVAALGRSLSGCLLPAPGWLGSRQPTSSASSNGTASFERLLETWSRLPSAAVSSSQPRLAQSKALQLWRGCAGTETGIVIRFPVQPLRVEPGFGQLAKCPCPERVMHLVTSGGKKKICLVELVSSASQEQSSSGQFFAQLTLG